VWFKVPWREQAFISWAGLRGAVPIIMATVPLGRRRPVSAERISEEVLVFVIVFTLVQGRALPWVARKLGIVDDAAALDIEVEVAPLDRIQADFMQVKVPEGSKLHGVTIGELRLPRFTVISVIVRDGPSAGPVAAGPDPGRRRTDGGRPVRVTRPQTEKRFRDVGRHGRLARWLRE
jgi:cell volume regulation protein A